MVTLFLCNFNIYLDIIKNQLFCLKKKIHILHVILNMNIILLEIMIFSTLYNLYIYIQKYRRNIYIHFIFTHVDNQYYNNLNIRYLYS